LCEIISLTGNLNEQNIGGDNCVLPKLWLRLVLRDHMQTYALGQHILLSTHLYMLVIRPKEHRHEILHQ